MSFPAREKLSLTVSRLTDKTRDNHAANIPIPIRKYLAHTGIPVRIVRKSSKKDQRKVMQSDRMQ